MSGSLRSSDRKNGHSSACTKRRRNRRHRCGSVRLQIERMIRTPEYAQSVAQPSERAHFRDRCTNLSATLPLRTTRSAVPLKIPVCRGCNAIVLLIRPPIPGETVQFRCGCFLCRGFVRVDSDCISAVVRLSSAFPVLFEETSKIFHSTGGKKRQKEHYNSVFREPFCVNSHSLYVEGIKVGADLMIFLLLGKYIDLVAETQKKYSPGTKIYSRFTTAIQALKQGDPFLYSPGFVDCENAWNLDEKLFLSHLPYRHQPYWARKK